MPRCTATTKKGRRCRNGALAAEPFCEIHYRLREERATGPKNTREGEATAGAEDPSPAKANDRGAGKEDAPAPPPGAAGRALEGLESESGPEESSGAAPRDPVGIDPELFAGLEDAEKEAEPDSPAPPSARPPPRRGALLDANPGPWHPGALEGVILPPLNRKFSADAVPELGGAEADAFLEALAASLNRIASRVDPNNPYAALALSSSVMLGTRYVPRMLRKPSKNGTGAASADDDDGAEETADPRARGSGDRGEAEEPTSSWADRMAPTL